MKARRKTAAFARSHKKHIVIGHIAVIAGLLAAFFAGAFTGSVATNYFGVHLSPKGVEIYKKIEAKGGIEKHGRAGDVTLTPGQIAALKASAAKAASQLHPNVQATPQPKVLVQPIPTNFYPSPTVPEILVAHDTESQNAPGIADLEAVRAWFSNPNAQASANYVDDATGNVIEMVDPTTKTAWHVANFNHWAIGVEQIGFASQTRWPLAQIEATAKIFAHWATKYGIPIRHGAVSGCTIVRTGIVFHSDLGLCGGGHHDPGAHYPLGLLIRLTKMYAGVKPPPTHPAKVIVPAVLLHRGDHGHAVLLLQKALDAYGAHLHVDGDFGPATFAAVEAFQKTHHLTIDGIVGVKTRRALNA